MGALLSQDVIPGEKKPPEVGLIITKYIKMSIKDVFSIRFINLARSSFLNY